jgi:hypothetical protein|tara:strand:+ start:10104 stop:10634 length:531 start_codon:yes stop_codon:yes gene_type:complete
VAWFGSVVDHLKQLTKTEPLDCPRGWESVTFNISAMLFPWPMIDLECPISGKESCEDCSYARNPDAFMLREQLEELARLEQEGLISPDERNVRRVEMLELFEARVDWLAVAWILGPLGLVFTLAGGVLGFGFHGGFLVFACAGLVGLALSLSFSVIADRRTKKQRFDIPLFQKSEN